MEAAHHDREAFGAEPAGEIERARKLIRLHADEADHAGAGFADAFGHARDIDDGVALVAGLDLDVDVRAERLLARALLDQAMNAGEAVGRECRAQPLDDIAVRVVVRRLDQNDAEALGRASVHLLPPQREPRRNTPRSKSEPSRAKVAVRAKLRQSRGTVRFWGPICNAFQPELAGPRGVWTNERPCSRAACASEFCNWRYVERRRTAAFKGKEGVVPAFTSARLASRRMG